MQDEDVALVRQWFERLAACMRAADYAGARPLFAEDVMGFGSVAGFVSGRDALETEQWHKVWGVTEGIRFGTETMFVTVSDDRLLAVGAAGFESTGWREDGTPYDRPGRSTVVLVRATPGEAWVARHVHFSLLPGVPARSFGRPG